MTPLLAPLVVGCDSVGPHGRFIFGVTLTDAEHVALVKHFDRDGDGTIDNAEFQSAFFRLADEGKDEFKRAQVKSHVPIGRSPAAQFLGLVSHRE